MAIALVTSAKGASADTNTAVTSSANTSSATLLVLAICDWTGGSACTPIDSKGNTWTGLTAYTYGNCRVQLWYCVNPTVGTGHTFTRPDTPGSAYPAIFMMAFSGTATSSPLDASQSGNGASSGTSVAPGSITPSENNEVVVSACNVHTSDPTSASGMTLAQHTNTGPTNFGGGIAYEIQTTATARNPTWSWAASSHNAASIAAFKSAAKASLPQKSKTVSQALNYSVNW